jgi:ATP synthase F1 delta subunit
MPKSARPLGYEHKVICTGKNHRMTAASRYAQALFSLAEEAKQQPAVASGVAALAASVADPVVASALANPLLTSSQRKALAVTMAKSVKAPASLANTLGVLAENNRLAILPAVLSVYQTLNDNSAGITHVKLSSATALTEAQRTRLTDLIKKHTKATDIRLEETIDATLQGGFRAFFDGKVWDASLSGSIARLGTRLMASVTQRQN